MQRTLGNVRFNPELTYDKIVGVLTDCRTKPIKEFSQGFVHNMFALTAGHDSFLRKRGAERAWKKKKRTVSFHITSNFTILLYCIHKHICYINLNCIIIFSAAFQILHAVRKRLKPTKFWTLKSCYKKCKKKAHYLKLFHAKNFHLNLIFNKNWF